MAHLTPPASIAAAAPPADGIAPTALAAALVARGCTVGQARRAAAIVGHGIWRQNQAWPDIVGRCGKQVRAALEDVCSAPMDLEIAGDAESADGTRKLLLRTVDGQLIESVIIAATSGTRTTLCVSSQVGCGRRCAFCETGRLGLVRNLAAHEIATQVRMAQRLWGRDRPGEPPIRNIVFMGMGEPMDNLSQVAAAIAVLTDDLGGGLSWRRVTVSTVGVASQLPSFFRTVKANLAVSLNAPDDARRSLWMPINDRCGLAELKAVLLAALPQGRDVLLEYILFAGANDSLHDAELLRLWLDGLPARLNLIPANPGPDAGLTTPSPERVHAFQKYLLDRGVRAMVRYPHGRDIGGACGQLAGQRAAAWAARTGR